MTNLPETLIEAIDQGIAPWTKLVRKDFHVSVYEDQFPVTVGHLLFVPAYHTHEVLRDCIEDALREGRRMISDGLCTGFNVGVNYGEDAGQTVRWPHVHLIPRRPNDTANVVGGVRKVVDGQGDYHSSSYVDPNKNVEGD